MCSSLRPCHRHHADGAGGTIPGARPAGRLRRSSALLRASSRSRDLPLADHQRDHRSAAPRGLLRTRASCARLATPPSASCRWRYSRLPWRSPCGPPAAFERAPARFVAIARSATGRSPTRSPLGCASRAVADSRILRSPRNPAIGFLPMAFAIARSATGRSPTRSLTPGASGGGGRRAGECAGERRSDRRHGCS